MDSTSLIPCYNNHRKNVNTTGLNQLMSDKNHWREAVLDSIDVEAWEQFADHYGKTLELDEGPKSKNVSTRHETNYFKYFDLDEWIHYHVNVAMSLGLHKREPMTIMDLGCGSGILCKVLKTMGHDARGCDIFSAMYVGMARVLKVEVTPFVIEAFKAFDANFSQYDLITATSTKFDQPEFSFHGKPSWGEKEWRFFLHNCGQHLNEGGEVYMKLNKQPDDSLYADEATKALFHGVARAVDENAGHLFDRDALLALETN